MSEYKVGDRVGFSWRRYCYDRNPNVILDYKEDLILKGFIKNIKYKRFFVFKRKDPLYKVCNCWVKTVKPILKVKNGVICE